MAAARRSRLSAVVDLAWLCHVHGGTCVGACNVWAGGSSVRARVGYVRTSVGDVRATGVAELGVRRAGRLVLHLRLWALLLLGSLLQAHLLHLALAHQLSVVLLIVGCVASSVHVGILLQWSVLLLLLLLLGLLLLLRDVLLLLLMCLVLSTLLGAACVAIGAVRNGAIGLVRGLVVVVCRRVIICVLLLLLLLLGIADPSSGVHCILTHLTRRLRLVFQLFRSEVGKLHLGHLWIACPQLILNLYDRRNVTRG